MPSGAVHTVTNLAALGALHAFTGGLPTFVIAGALLGTILITPDLDLAGHVNVRARRAWGALGALWAPLSLFVKHRGLTHTYLRGPVLLLAYAGAIACLVYFALRAITHALGVSIDGLSAGQPWPERVTLLGWTQLLGGFLTAYWLHLALDRILPWEKGRW